MALQTTALVEEVAIRGRQDFIVNEFNIQAATINGSGSQSSNMVLLRSIFQMGVPVSGKNIFPSNIAGLPTWYTIRVNKDGYVARKKEIDILVAMNPDTANEDITSLNPGAVAVCEESLNLSKLRNDLIFYPVPFSKLAAECASDVRLRKLLANMIYVGVLSQLLGIDRVEIEKAILKQFKNKPKAVDLNLKAVDLAANYVQKNLPKKDPYVIRRMDKTKGKIIIDGNSAAAIGAMFAGVSVVTWYPITPSSSLCETLIEYLKAYRIDKETNKATFAVIQAEDEIAALGMVIGAGWAGARAMTSTSGPGISLMAEFAGLGYFAEVPGVIFDIQRIGPSTGLPTRTSQGDILSAVFLSHGDTKHIVLIPASVEECYSMAIESFDLAERFQTPVFVLSDLDLGMNNWMADPLSYPDKPMDRGKILTAKDLERIKQFDRYRDLDGDGIPYRTLPGTPHALAPYFTRGSGHNEQGQYSEKPEDYKNLMDRLNRKYDTARSYVPAPVIDLDDRAEIGVIAYGSTHWAIVEARDRLRALNVPTGYLRLRALPFNDELKKFVANMKHVYIVEQNRDGQMAELIRLAVDSDSHKIKSICHYDGLPVDAKFVIDAILTKEQGE